MLSIPFFAQPLIPARIPNSLNPLALDAVCAFCSPMIYNSKYGIGGLMFSDAIAVYRCEMIVGEGEPGRRQKKLVERLVETTKKRLTMMLLYL